MLTASEFQLFDVVGEKPKIPHFCSLPAKRACNNNKEDKEDNVHAMLRLCIMVYPRVGHASFEWDAFALRVVHHKPN